MFNDYRVGLKIKAIIITGLLMLPGAVTHANTLWGDLKPGPYGIGFKTIEKYDYQRPVGPILDYFGAPLEGERSRPMQMCIWYPADRAESDMPLVYGEYAFTNPEDEEFITVLSALQNREIGYLGTVFGGDRGFVLDVMSLELTAVRDAQPHEGSFPLIAYHPDLAGGVGDNAVLCEYLASHGFIVATAHSLGTIALNAEAQPNDLESFARDLEFVIANVQELPHLDCNKLGVMGCGFGGAAALLLQMRSSGVAAVATLAGSFVDSRFVQATRENPYFGVERMHVPLFQAYCTAESTLDLSLVESLTYSPRFSLGIDELHPINLSTYGLMLTSHPSMTEAQKQAVTSGYPAVCRYVMNFFKAHLNGDNEAAEFVRANPEEHGFAGGLHLELLPGQEVPPTLDQFGYILRTYGVDTASGLYYKFRALDPEMILFNEAAMNALAYQRLQSNQVPEAIALFKMNADSYPASANVWDSLADGYRAANELEKAAECYRKLLEALPNDAGANEQLKEILRNNAEQFLEQN